MNVKILIVGRKNVGKSSLFNFLAKKKIALIEKSSNTTVDFLYFNKAFGKKITIIDTPAIQKKNKLFANKKILLKIKEVNVVFFVFDVLRDLSAIEIYFLQKIKKEKKKCFILINKIDNVQSLYDIKTFYKLGTSNVYYVSILKKIKIDFFIKNGFLSWLKKLSIMPFPKRNVSSLKKKINVISIIGRPNTGKSTLVNALLGENRVLVADYSGTTKDSVETLTTIKNINFNIIDTAGIKKKKKIRNGIGRRIFFKTLESIEKANIILFLMKRKEVIRKQDLKIMNLIKRYKKPVIILINKSENLSEKKKRIFEVAFSRYLKNFFFVKIHFISALYLKGITRIFTLIKNINFITNQKITNHLLTKILKKAIFLQPITCTIKGKKKKIALKYAHLIKKNPLVILIHGTKVKKISASKKKYLENFFCKSLKFKGIPVTLYFKEQKNPYI